MKLIECTLGMAVEPMVAGRPYPFTRDEHSRFVCRVDNEEHAAVLLAVEHYREVPEKPAPAKAKKPAAPAPVQDPAQTQDSPPVQTPTQEPSQQQPGFVDDIGLIKGIGPTVKTKLEAIGFASIEQIATLTEEDIKRLDAQLELKGGITRFAWVEQAAKLLEAKKPAQA